MRMRTHSFMSRPLISQTRPGQAWHGLAPSRLAAIWHAKLPMPWQVGHILPYPTLPLHPALPCPHTCPVSGLSHPTLP